MLDLRIPTGLFFTLIGAILCVTGLVSDARAALTTMNVNLAGGAVMLVFGVFLLWLARRRA